MDLLRTIGTYIRQAFVGYRDGETAVCANFTCHQSPTGGDPGVINDAGHLYCSAECFDTRHENALM